MTVNVYTVADDCVHRDSDSVHSVSATVTVTVYTVTVWQSGCDCTQRQSACECVHRGRVTVTVTVYTVRQCDIVTVQQWQWGSAIVTVYTVTV